METNNNDILADIDATLELLIQNADAIKFAKVNHQFVHELKLLQDTQESLLARLANRQSLLDSENKKTSLSSMSKRSIASLARTKMRRPQNAARSRKARSKS